MTRPRIIPCLLLNERALVKTVKFKNDLYIGDPINAIKIFNELFVDELIVLDIGAGRNRTEPDFEYIKELASESFIPMCYGGGVSKVEHIQKLFFNGIEKISLCTNALLDPKLVREAVRVFGSQSVVGCLDLKKDWLGKYHVYVKGGTEKLPKDPLVYAKELVDMGIGELFINCIDKDGAMSGYDINIIKKFSDEIKSLPIIACGGAGSLKDIVELANQVNISAIAAGSCFVFRGNRNAILINYPEYEEINRYFDKV